MPNPFEEIFERLDEFILERGYDGYRHLYSLAMFGAFPGILNVLGFELNKEGYNEAEYFLFKYKPKVVEDATKPNFSAIVAYEEKHIEVARIPAISILNHISDLKDFSKKKSVTISLKNEEELEEKLFI